MPTIEMNPSPTEKDGHYNGAKMCNPQRSSDECYITEVYEIRIRGHLQDRWAEWFERLTISRENDGTTTLFGPLPDQTALHSILTRIRDMNLELISVTQVEKSSNE